MTVRVSVEGGFLAALKKLPPDRAKAASSAVVKFQAEPNLPSHKLHKLHNHDGYWIIYAHHGDRIILRKDADDLYAAVDVGPHENVYRRWDRMKR